MYMYLTKEEEWIYEGEKGWAKKKAMEILVAIGDINNALCLKPIKTAHISGASYKTIGEAVEFIHSLEEGEGSVEVRSTLNPIGMDIERWKEMGISKNFAAKQKEVLDAYKKLGISTICTCAPYLLYTPAKGEHLAWSESSAVLYANSVLGAYSNMEGAPSALASAIIGKTPFYGLHKEEERKPEIRVKIKLNKRCEDADYGALGLLIGNLVEEKIPLIELSSSSLPDDFELKQLAAAIGASSSVGMFHLRDITSQPKNFADTDVKKLKDKVEVEKEDIDGFYEENEDEEPEVIAFGCPHSSSKELRNIYKLLKAKREHGEIRKELLIFTSRETKRRNKKIVEDMEKMGAKVFCDTCFVVSPAFEKYRCVMTNSGKMKKYAPYLCGAKVILRKTKECVKEAFY